MSAPQNLKISESVFHKEDERIGILERGTSLFRKAPAVFIIGAQKSGTTSLYRFLVDNNVISASKRKEIQFFNNTSNYNKGIGWYRSHFPMFSSGLTCDASANTLESEEAPVRLKECFPNAKIIVLLRNPADRAYSHYKMAVKHGFESLSFEEALELEDERIAFGRSAEKHNYPYQRLGYRTKGIYSQQLKRWFEVFSRDQFYIVQSERLFGQSKEVCQEIYDFLELKTPVIVPFQKINAGGGEQLSDSTRLALNNFYASHNSELFRLLGERYDWA